MPVPPEFPARSELVRIEVKASDENGSLLRTLTVGDLELRCNGRVVAIDSIIPVDAATQPEAQSVLVLLDDFFASNETVSALASAVPRLLGELGQADWVALWAPESGVREVGSSPDSHATLRAAADRLKPSSARRLLAMNPAVAHPGFFEDLWRLRVEALLAGSNWLATAPPHRTLVYVGSGVRWPPVRQDGERAMQSLLDTLVRAGITFSVVDPAPIGIRVADAPERAFDTKTPDHSLMALERAGRRALSRPSTRPSITRELAEATDGAVVNGIARLSRAIVSERPNLMVGFRPTDSLVCIGVQELDLRAKRPGVKLSYRRFAWIPGAE